MSSIVIFTVRKLVSNNLYCSSQSFLPPRETPNPTYHQTSDSYNTLSISTRFQNTALAVQAGCVAERSRIAQFPPSLQSSSATFNPSTLSTRLARWKNTLLLHTTPHNLRRVVSHRLASSRLHLYFHASPITTPRLASDLFNPSSFPFTSSIPLHNHRLFDLLPSLAIFQAK